MDVDRRSQLVANQKKANLFGPCGEIGQRVAHHQFLPRICSHRIESEGQEPGSSNLLQYRNCLEIQSGSSVLVV